MSLYVLTLFTHSYVRWLVVALLLSVIVRAAIGWIRENPWSARDERWHAALVGVVDLQFTLGLTLYALLSPLSAAFFANARTAMHDPVLRFFGVEHAFGMFSAVSLVHVGRTLSKRAASGRQRHRRTCLWTLGALLVIAVSIPWPDRPYGRPWLRSIAKSTGDVVRVVSN
jgi:hypothetical protein